MQNNICVSVIVPIYNQEKYLNKSIPSIINQSYSNLDIVLVNDGSTDSSIDIIKAYEAKDNRIRIIEKENGGLVDATLAGISAAKGDWVCFLDPDDLIGENFVKFFVDNISDECDFVSAGFYYENKGVLTPYNLMETRFYDREQLLLQRNNFLCEEGNPNISNRFFISRWNKFYRYSLVKKVSERFESCKGISLGEDTVFTYLALCFANGGKTIAEPNSYFYNIGSQNSMMKIGKMEVQQKKCVKAFEALKSFTEEFNTDVAQAYALYYLLTESIFGHLKNSDYKQYKACRAVLKNDKYYQISKKMITPKIKSGKKFVKYYIRKIVYSRPLYKILKGAYNFAKRVMKYIPFWIKNCSKKGIVSATRLLSFQIKRDTAFTDIEKYLPKIEEQVKPILLPFLKENSSLDNTSIENNVFVLWWDGFENAPEVVRKCFESVRKYHPDFNVIGIDKNNYQNYTDIDPKIIEDFKKDKISVQTFSDILRFNLLKNNGGVWIDSTIMFLSKFNLVEDLKDKSFTSLEFSTSRDFLKYDGNECSWSGFFIASRKNGLFVTAVDEIFKQYYLKYNIYPIYLFIDAVLMICKKYGLDDKVLDKTLRTSDSMFTLSLLLGKPYNNDIIELIKNTPQKLQWNCESFSKEGTFYGWVLSRE
ncbi:MAG: glycosyltransferase [Ruminococcaceae bacterium]|nr:glycosyltransferase [Oscillospiraceae bacterium]